MANSNEPYRRLGTNSWQELLDQVNTVLQNPPPGCDPIDTIDGPDPEHKWSKGDIIEVHDRLNTMPGDCFTFQPIPDKWKVSIIEGIEDQLSNAWCDCRDECLPQCSNAQPSAVVTYLGSWETGDCLACIPPAPECSITPYTEQMTFARNAGILASGERGDWDAAYIYYCTKVAQLTILEDELAVLLVELAILVAIAAVACILPLSPACIAAEAAVAAKQAEVDAKEIEIDAKQVEVDAELANANAHLSACNAHGVDSMQYAQDACGYVGCDVCLVGEIGSEPCVDYDCDELGGPCLGKDPVRCCVTWSLTRKQTQLAPFFSEGSWQIVMRGGYSPTGQPYITFVGTGRLPCISGYACSSYGPNACKYGCNGAIYRYEARLTQVFPPATGEECCDDP
jgi:hypothetical protein